MRLKATSIVLDGEAMCFTGVEHDFDKLWNRIHDYEATLCAFDLLELDGEDYRARPLLERKRRLFKLLKRHPAGLSTSSTWTATAPPSSSMRANSGSKA